jgi:hypothetical protein
MSGEPPEVENDREGGFMAFWKTLPGILTGIAALITAVVGAIGLWRSQAGDNSRPTSSREPATVAATTETGTSQRKGAAPGTLAEGRLSLVRNDWADLERGEIRNSSNVDLAFGPESTPTLRAAASSFFATAETRPGKQACATALSARHDTAEIVPELDTNWICISTTEGHVAVLRIIRAPGVGSAKLTLGYTVWQ